MIREFITALRSAGLEEVTVEEIADILWLATQREMGLSARAGVGSAAPVVLPQAVEPRTDEQGVSEPVQLDELSSNGKGQSDVHLPDSDANVADDIEHMGSAGGVSFPAAAAPALPNRLAVGRSLRGLSRRISSPVATVFDEEATIRRIAEEGNWIPLHRPAPERWLDLALVMDESANMVVWQQAVDELHTLLECQGAFRIVTRWGLRADHTVFSEGRDPLPLYIGSRFTSGHLPPTRRPEELIHPQNRRLILVMSDCVALGWHDGRVEQLLSVWAQTGMVSLVQVLPEDLWVRTGLGAGIQMETRALYPGAPNSKLARRYRWRLGSATPPNGLLLPVTTLEPERLSLWARSLVARDNVWNPAILFPTRGGDLPTVTKGPEDSTSLTSIEWVERFLQEASPQARRLASFLAVVSLSLPVMRLVQEAMKEDTQQVHLAEIFLSGLIRRCPDQKDNLHPDEVRYDFRTGVREVLLMTLLESEIEAILESTSHYVNQHTGQPISFQALLVNPYLASQIKHNDFSRSFAVVTAQVLRFLGGKFTELAEQLANSTRSAITLRDAGNSETVRQRLSNYPIFATLTQIPPSIDGRASLRPTLFQDEMRILADIMALLPNSYTEQQRNQVLRAYLVASDAHSGQLRMTGEAYILHPLAVTKILSELFLDPDTLAAGLLHDVVEDTDYSLEYLYTQFNPEIATLVDGVTKLSRLNELSSIGQGVADENAESLRKIFLAMVEDVRVVLIKLADRLHNMRTLQVAPDHKRRQIARETLEIFAPLANRLGIWQIKWELEDLSLRYLEPSVYRELSKAMDQKRTERVQWVEEVQRLLRNALDESHIKAEINDRPKHIYSIYRKMQRKDVPFEQIYDIHGFRIVVGSVGDCYAALGVVHSLWRPIHGEFDDYIANPKDNLYRSLHTAVVGPLGKSMEVQIRTQEMHQLSEFGIAAHWRYKEQSKPNMEMDNKIAWIRQLMEWRQDVTDAKEFVSGMKTDDFKDRVYIFTLRGDVVDLPRDATPIDLAYHIHTELGHRCRGAKVNGKLVTLNTPLNSGETVEIVTAKRGGPSRDWINPNLGYVTTQRARAKIRTWFRTNAREQNIIQGRQVLEKELKHLSSTLTFEAVAKLCSYENLDDFLFEIGTGDVSSQHIAELVSDYEHSQERSLDENVGH